VIQADRGRRGYRKRVWKTGLFREGREVNGVRSVVQGIEQ